MDTIHRYILFCVVVVFLLLGHQMDLYKNFGWRHIFSHIQGIHKDIEWGKKDDILCMCVLSNNISPHIVKYTVIDVLQPMCEWYTIFFQVNIFGACVALLIIIIHFICINYFLLPILQLLFMKQIKILLFFGSLCQISIDFVFVFSFLFLIDTSKFTMIKKSLTLDFFLFSNWV